MKRKYVKPEFKVDTWELLQTYFDELEKRPINSFDELYKWLLDYNELGAVVSEDMAWRYIKMTCDTNNTALRDSYNDFVQNIEPKMAPISNRLNEKLMASPFKEQLKKQGYPIYLRGIKNSIDLFREKNIPLNTQLQELEQKFGEISGAQSIEHNGETITLQKAGVFLKDLNREVRKTVYDKVQTRRAQDETALNDLFNQLVKLRQQVALNTGFKNYRDFKHQQLARFDYSVQDCLNFHESVKQHAVPLVDEHDKRRKAKLNLQDYRPWDTSVDEEGLPPLKPFQTAQELIDKTIACFNRLDPFFGDCVATMHKMNRLDLESRIGKAPGGYQYPLYETNVPFIFMNSVGLHRDLVTMVHEGGHAIHSFLDFDLELVEFKSPPSEIAELASMSMELMSMEHWEVFFENKEELRRAKRQQLESVIDALPWIAAIDKFQHWLYANPAHTNEERTEKWMAILSEYSEGAVDYSGLETYRSNAWQRQLHLFEVPFYYIEYGIAQLGAIGMWMQFKQNPGKALDNYCNALALGGTATLPQLYETAGLKFDFSPAVIKELMDFVKMELDKVQH